MNASTVPFRHFGIRYLDAIQMLALQSCSTVEEIEELLMPSTLISQRDPIVSLPECAYSIAPSLTKLFNRSIASGCYPQAWKLARIVPIHKSGDKATPSNYRPISIVSKVLERHVHTVVSNFLAENAPIIFMPVGLYVSGHFSLKPGQISQIPWNHASLRHVLVPPGNSCEHKSYRKLTGLLYCRLYRYSSPGTRPD